MRRATPYLWRHANLVAPLLSLAYLERACAHVRLGWLPKLEALDVKIALGQHQYLDLTTSQKLERAFRAMTRLTGLGDGAVSRAHRTVMRAIDASRSGDALVRQIYGVIKPALAERYAELIALADPVLDAHLLETLEPALAEAKRQIAWARRLVRGKRPRTAAVRRLLRAPLTRTGLPRDAWLWPPLDRVPDCVRPPALTRVRPGKMAHRLSEVPGSRGACAEFFHHLTGTELATMELFGRSLYEHPDMPEEFHHDYARVTWDEARHAELAIGQAAKLGLPFGSIVIDISTYETNYEYPGCKPGSKAELLWRLLIQGTFQESLIIEGFPLQARKMRFGKLEAQARIADAIAEEEVSHVATALKWARVLCGGNEERVTAERARAHRYTYELIMDARRRYVAEHPDQAIAETERLHGYAKRAKKTFPFSLHVHVNRPARRVAGFTEAEIEQVLDWGYLRP